MPHQYHWPSGPTLTSQTVPVNTSVHRVTGKLQAVSMLHQYHWPSGPTLTFQTVSVDRSIHSGTGCIKAPPVSLTIWTHTHFPNCFYRQKCTQNHRLHPCSTSIMIVRTHTRSPLPTLCSRWCKARARALESQVKHDWAWSPHGCATRCPQEFSSQNCTRLQKSFRWDTVPSEGLL